MATKSVLSAIVVTMLASATTLSAHIVRGILFPTLATAFVSSPSGALDSPIPIAWGAEDTGLRVACFYVANTSPVVTGGWPRITAVGFELPGPRSGFSLLAPANADWRVVDNVPASLLGRGNVTLDFVIVANGLGIPPGQTAARGNGTRFCLSGPFPDGLNIEQLINGVVVGYQAQASGPIIEMGLWDSPQRTVPLFP